MSLRANAQVMCNGRPSMTNGQTVLIRMLGKQPGSGSPAKMVQDELCLSPA
jgi:hypothetical protein